MRRSKLLPALAASGFTVTALFANAAVAQTAAPAPSVAEATTDALKKAAAGSIISPVTTPAAVPAAPPANAAAAPAKPSALAKAKAILPWNKPKASATGDAAAADAVKAVSVKAAAVAKAPAASPADPPKTDAAAAATETAKPAVVKAPAAAKTAAAPVPVKGANGEVMSGPMAATHAFFGANTYAAPAPSKTAVRSGCTRLAHSSIDVGKENPIKFSREGIDNQIAALTKTKGWKATVKSDEKIICTEYVNLGLFGQEYTCRVETTVCPK
jgi:hypothetical protein